jgi:hypothetical protein
MAPVFLAMTSGLSHKLIADSVFAFVHLYGG